MAFLKRIDTLICRRENYGGVVFDGKRGVILELDREAYRFLEMCNGYLDKFQIQKRLSEEFKKDFAEMELNKLIRRLMGLMIIYYEEQDNNGIDEVFSDNWPSCGYLTAPETVHWAVTYKCNLSCRHCYVGKDSIKGEMGFEEIKQFIDFLKKINVFQLAIGGGEPFLRSDLPEIIDYAYKKGIVTNITTNGTRLNRGLLNKLKNKVGRLQISFDQEGILESVRDNGMFDKMRTGIELVRKMKIPFGLNLIITKSNIKNIETIIDFFYKAGASQISLLRPKQAYGAHGWYRDEALTGKQYYCLKEMLGHLANQYPFVKFYVDCALSFLMKGVSLRRLKFHGVYGCRAGERFIVILPNGDIYPCSHFINTNSHVGNILRDDFYYLWHTSPVLKKFRTFRKNLLFRKTDCGRCDVSEYCGGCRALVETFTNSFYEDDPDCF